jgi:hypothetical protein
MKNEMPVTLQVIKPFVNNRITISNGEEMVPTPAGYCNEIQATVFVYLFTYTHVVIKITIYRIGARVAQSPY